MVQAPTFLIFSVTFCRQSLGIGFTRLGSHPKRSSSSWSVIVMQGLRRSASVTVPTSGMWLCLSGRPSSGVFPNYKDFWERKTCKCKGSANSWRQRQESLPSSQQHRFQLKYFYWPCAIVWSYTILMQSQEPSCKPLKRPLTLTLLVLYLATLCRFRLGSDVPVLPQRGFLRRWFLKWCIHTFSILFAKV